VPDPASAPGAEAAGPSAPQTSPANRPASGSPPWLLIGGALLVGLVAGGLVTLLVARQRRAALPPRTAGQSPAERARELQVALERWWLDARGSAKAEALEERMRGLRRDLEAVRFAPGRADHSETVAELEERLRSLMRLA
jgi:hypothetical protein